MGYRSTIVVMHDRLHDIANDPSFGKKISDACGNFRYGTAAYGTGFQVIEQDHADANSVVLVHDYSGECLCSSMSRTDVEALKALAEKLGYRLVKKK